MNSEEGFTTEEGQKQWLGSENGWTIVVEQRIEVTNNKINERRRRRLTSKMIAGGRAKHRKKQQNQLLFYVSIW